MNGATANAPDGSKTKKDCTDSTIFQSLQLSAVRRIVPPAKALKSSDPLSLAKI